MQTYVSNPCDFSRLNIVLAACCLVVGLVGLIYTQVAIDTPYYDFSRFNDRAFESLSLEQRTVGSFGDFQCRKLDLWCERFV